ncbi:phosphatidylserine synthase [Proteiniborus sp. DW1]|uniref:CDP-alcohol phosphatidyltransferase family protein n=1 Tax=Proteiniborus sp. DW1 TaxID=1889883 RepID=UPI00092E039E|nr:CDP-alcohol phosphatidyltransferase family protein [Proteiniborus sp. DW1]SCG84331.1 phosphatidylserine synthase [Proteiniborus sp. DW1]
MIGFYDYTVILTYISLLCSVFGITQAIDGKFRIAIVCLAISGLCDVFDGKIARTKKERTDDQKLFGVQIDSLCDVICFGVFPTVICYILGVRGILGGIVIGYYCVCSVIRLGFFNVLETNRQIKEDGANKYYYGLPITSITIILPVVFLLSFFIPAHAFKWVLLAMLFIVATLFILNFRLRKPTGKQLSLLIIIVAFIVSIILLCSDYGIKHRTVQEGALIHELCNRWNSE